MEQVWERVAVLSGGRTVDALYNILTMLWTAGLRRLLLLLLAAGAAAAAELLLPLLLQLLLPLPLPLLLLPLLLLLHWRPALEASAVVKGWQSC